MPDVFSREVFHHTVQDYVVSLGMFWLVYIVLWVVRTMGLDRLQGWAKQTSTGIDDFLVGVIRRHIGPAVYFFTALYVATRSLTLPASVEQVLSVVFVIVLTLKVVQVTQAVVVYALEAWLRRARPDSPSTGSVAGNLALLIRLTLWGGGALFVLDNLGINVTAFVAGLGVGGVAVALAAQAVLGDAFSSFAIFLDKPFEVGDFIIVGDLQGTVEQIGFKTTRLRSLEGEELIFSNSDLTSSRVRNYKRMRERRVVFKLGVVYQTSSDQVQAVPGIIRKIIEADDRARFDRAHFQGFGDFALIFEVAYFVLSPDYNAYMDVQERINVRLKEEFERAGIEFAYPTQSLYVTKAESAPSGRRPAS